LLFANDLLNFAPSILYQKKSFMRTKPTLLLLLLCFIVFSSCNNESTTPDDKKDSANSTNSTSTASVREEAVAYNAGDASLKGYVAYDENKKGARPIVLVVHEWWGLTDYPRTRAKQLAEMGYFAMAVDMYGDGKLADNPKDAEAAATPFYQNPQMAKARLDAALAKAKTYAQADSTQTVAIGYCFGGTMVLNYAKLGAPVAGVVSFHGGLAGVPSQKGTKAEFLICHGGADGFVPQPQVDGFKKSMDSAALSYTFKTYDGATHAFTNPKADEYNKKFGLPINYNGKADTASWNDMKDFFGKILH
jgi:dienelactone hydrolase